MFQRPLVDVIFLLHFVEKGQRRDDTCLVYFFQLVFYAFDDFAHESQEVLRLPNGARDGLIVYLLLKNWMRKQLFFIKYALAGCHFFRQIVHTLS